MIVYSEVLYLMKTTFNPTIKNNLLNQIKSKKPMLLENAMIYQDGMFKKMNLFFEGR